MEFFSAAGELLSYALPWLGFIAAGLVLVGASFLLRPSILMEEPRTPQDEKKAMQIVLVQKVVRGMGGMIAFGGAIVALAAVGIQAIDTLGPLAMLFILCGLGVVLFFSALLVSATRAQR